ncbi:polysaccharide biosynthesis protein [Elizabethkingia sp. YR214]|uniref:oligosaccharide flippase family protein n=1 Tax=Elizabethkingia sp. YR214 TaxID=2135667 RepID=UPI000D3238F1|nr:oligosaccharide flippase family protein [Elizabethkingia sp. YR214]PUB28528.1 polysaccharide biosynthesis protein [Elizabethkingia sp. YR214]
MINKSNIFVYFGTFISQCLTLLTSLIVLKYISPELYGRFNYIISFGSIIGSLSTLKFEQSISIAKDLGDCLNRFRLSIQTSFFITIAASPFLFFFFKLEFIELVFIFFLSISIALFASLQQIFLFTNQHKINALLVILVASVNIALLFILYKYPYGLEYSYISAYFFSSILVLIYTWKSFFKYDLFKVSDYFKDFKFNKFFPTTVLPMSAIGVLLLYGNSIVLMYLYSENEVGIFSFTVRILTLPVILISSVSSGLFKAKLAKHFHALEFNEFNKEKKSMLLFLIVGALIMFPILAVILLNIDKFIHIGKWTVINNYVIILTFYAISQFILIPFQSIPVILEKKKVLLYSNIILFLGITTIYLISTGLDFKTFLMLYSGFNLLFSIVVVYVYYNLKVK